MEIIRRLIQNYRQLITAANEYIPRGRNLIETELKLSCYQSLIQCATIVSNSLIFIFFIEHEALGTLVKITSEKYYAAVFFKTSERKVSFMDLYFTFFMHAYFGIRGAAFADLMFDSRYPMSEFCNVLGLFAISLGHLIEYGWYYSTGVWLRNPRFYGIYKNRFYDQLLILLIESYQVYTCAIAIYNVIHAFLQLKEHQQMLDSLPKFKLKSSAVNGG